MNERDEELFISLIIGLHATAMFQLGKVVNPLTQKTERDLRSAKETIDLLSTLEEKTRGNLTEIEDKYLKNTLLELRLNFVEEVKKEEKSAREPQEEHQDETGEETTENLKTDSSGVDNKVTEKEEDE